MTKKCEFTTDDLGDHGSNVSTWLTDNCAKIGEAIDALVNEDLVGSGGAQFGEQVDTNSLGYVGLVENKDNQFKQLFQKVGKPAIDSFYQSRDPQPAWIPRIGSIATSAGSESFTGIYKELLNTKELHKNQKNMEIITKSATTLNKQLTTAEQDLNAVKQLVKAVKTAQPAGIPTPPDEGRGWLAVHAGDGVQSLAYLEEQVTNMEAHLSNTRLAVDQLLELQKSWQALMDRNAKAAERLHGLLKYNIKNKYIDDTECLENYGKTCVEKLKDRHALKEKWLDLKMNAALSLNLFADMAAKVLTPAQAGAAITRPFKEQCLLLSNIYKLAQYKINYLEDPYGDHKRIAKKLPYVESAIPDGFSDPDPDGGAPPLPPTVGNACLMAQGNPWGFINILTQDSNYATLLDIPNSYLSQLAPKISLFKVVSVKQGASEGVLPITFDTHYDSTNDLENIFKNQDKRGFGVGLKSFNFSYEGSNPFAVKKSIKAKLVIFASSFDDLLVDRGGWRYADLALKTGGNLQEFLERSNQTADAIVANVTKLNFRLRVVVGWQMPIGRWEGGKAAGSDIKSAGTPLQKAVYNSFFTLNLTPTIHEFDIDDLGRVVFTINYLAYTEDFFDQPSFNIFANHKNHIESMKRKMKVAAWNEGCTPEAARDLKEKEAQKVEKEKKENLSTVLGHLLKRDKIMFVPIPRSDLAVFNEKGPYYDIPLLSDKPQFGNVADSDKIKKDFKDALDATYKQFKDGKDLSQTPIANMSQTEYVSFFYVSDLVDIVLENIELSLDKLIDALTKEKDPPTELDNAKEHWEALRVVELERLHRLKFNFKHFRVLLGPMELFDFKTGAVRDTNLGDVPISVSYFMDWLTQKVLSKDVTVYTLPNFLNDLFNGLVRIFLNNDTCYDINIKQKTRVFQSVVTSYAWQKATYDEITEYILAQRKSKTGAKNLSRMLVDKQKFDLGRTSGILNTMGVRDMPINKRDPALEYNYLIYYAGRTQPTERMQGNKAQDAASGIFHYMIGKPDGLVKTIKLTRTDSPGLKEVRFEQEGYDGLAQLRETYDATIECYGSPNIVPGTYIYIDPRGFAPKNKGTQGRYTFKDRNGADVVIDRFLLTRYGIGGYYMVIRTENKLAAGEFNTTIIAKWVAELGDPNDQRPYAGPRPSKCAVKKPALVG